MSEVQCPRSKRLYVNYDSQSDVLYIAMGEGMEEEYVEVAPGVNTDLLFDEIEEIEKVDPRDQDA